MSINLYNWLLMDFHYTHSTFNIPGSVLQQGFCVYLWDFTHSSQHYYYIGTSGDKRFPLAQSALVHLGKQVDDNKNAAQNQVLNQFKERNIAIAETTLAVHHWALPGLEAVAEALADYKPEPYPPAPLTKEEYIYGSVRTKYLEYLIRRKKVFMLERYLVYAASQKLDYDHLLNVGVSRKFKTAPHEYAQLATDLLARIEPFPAP